MMLSPVFHREQESHFDEGHLLLIHTHRKYEDPNSPEAFQRSGAISPGPTFRLTFVSMGANFDDLLMLMLRLRSECPWDREQTYATLAPMLLEEAYETFDAVAAAAKGRADPLREELGDLLFQIVFLSRVAEEADQFTIRDVIDGIHSKMVRRHPHVFGNVKADSSAEVLKNWEGIKAGEKRAGDTTELTPHSLLDEVPKVMPALMEAHQLGRKAATVGFDWNKLSDVLEKIQEEVSELQEAVKQHQKSALADDHQMVREELGDVLFSIANVARHLNVEPEAALKLTNTKFRTRFGHIENQIASRGRSLRDCTLDEMEDLWQSAKENLS